MLRCYAAENHYLIPVEDLGEPQDTAMAAAEQAREIIWYDLLEPTEEELDQVEQALSLSIPTKEKMKEIEASSRLYQVEGATFMTITLLSSIERDDPIKSQLTFVLKGPVLVMIRYADPTALKAFRLRSQRPTVSRLVSGEDVMLGIIEGLIDSTADQLEAVGDEIESASRDVFKRKRDKNASKNANYLQSLIERIGGKANILSTIRESLVSISRLVSYQQTNAPGSAHTSKEARQRLKLIQRDTASLSEHANFQAGKITFLLDATMGLINLEQNQITKIFSVASLIFLPPTLIGSIYGMNFKDMPELNWHGGYYFALLAMVIMAVLPLWFFKKRGWL